MSVEEKKQGNDVSQDAPAGDSDFFAKQTRRLLAFCEQVDPADIDSYIKAGGYEGLKKALSLSSEQVVTQLKESGLRGREIGRAHV